MIMSNEILIELFSWWKEVFTLRNMFLWRKSYRRVKDAAFEECEASLVAADNAFHIFVRTCPGSNSVADMLLWEKEVYELFIANLNRNVRDEAGLSADAYRELSDSLIFIRSGLNWLSMRGQA